MYIHREPGGIRQYDLDTNWDNCRSSNDLSGHGGCSGQLGLRRPDTARDRRKHSGPQPAHRGPGSARRSNLSDGDVGSLLHHGYLDGTLMPMTKPTIKVRVRAGWMVLAIICHIAAEVFIFCASASQDAFESCFKWATPTDTNTE